MTPEQKALGNYRKARLLAEPPEAADFSASEEKALAVLREVLRNADLLHPYDACLAYLLAIDIASRHGHTDEAKSLLESWYDFSVENKRETVEDALGLIAVAALICDGALATKTKVAATARKKLVANAIQELTDRFRSPEPTYPASRQHTIAVSHSQFYFEPLKSNTTEVYFQDPRESEQEFSAFTSQCAVSTPGDTNECSVELDLGVSIPSIDEAVQAVAVPISVKDDQGLFLRSVVELHSKYQFAVPKGEYDLVVRFFRQEKAKRGRFDQWRVVATLLPKGTVGAKCLKREHGDPPKEASPCLTLYPRKTAIFRFSA